MVGKKEWKESKWTLGEGKEGEAQEEEAKAGERKERKEINRLGDWRNRKTTTRKAEHGETSRFKQARSKKSGAGREPSGA
jgi:hypothetical protein